MNKSDFIDKIHEEFGTDVYFGCDSKTGEIIVIDPESYKVLARTGLFIQWNMDEYEILDHPDPDWREE